MIRAIQNAISPAKGGSIAPTFTRLGWLGFWLQIIIGSLPVILMAYFFAFSQANRPGLRFIEYLTIANLVLLAFAALWSYRYTRLGRRIADPARRPAQASVVKTVWTGVIVGAMGMFLSMTVLLIEAAKLLYYFLKAPQGGMPVLQTSGADAVHWISSLDMVSLVALVLMLFCELIVLAFALWLLFRSMFGSSEYPNTVEL